MEEGSYVNKGFEYGLTEDEDTPKGSQTSLPAYEEAVKNPKRYSIPSQALEEIVDPDDLRCGIGCFAPDWIQQYGTKKMFMFVFTILGVIQGMSWSYFSATISTLEKRFKISSQTSGILMTGNEISQIIFGLFISYYGGRGHRPRWIAGGVLFSALSCFMTASSHLFYGSGADALSLTQEYAGQYDSRFSLQEFLGNKSNGGEKTKVTLCQAGIYGKNVDDCGAKDEEIVPLIIFFLSQFVAGIGVLMFFTLGGPYLDDNSKKKNVPIVFGVTMSLRLVGPTIGYMIAFASLKTYVNPLLTPLINNADPRWIGAWWLGWLIFGVLMLLMSSFIVLFPRRLRKPNGKPYPSAPNGGNSMQSIRQMPRAVKLLLQNRINLFNNLAGVCYLFSGVGYWTYMPKYMETIFMQTASKSSMISGVVGILFSSTGLMISGILISKYQPSARKLAAWNVILAFTYVGAKIIFTQLGCDTGEIEFGTQNTDLTWNLTSGCNSDCNCQTNKILPVCYKEKNQVFYSACHAGCTSYSDGVISNCNCIPDDPNAELMFGNCAQGCSSVFLIFIAVNAIIKLLDSTGRIGNMLVSYRCVSIEERSLSIGLNIMLLSLLTFLPSPIFFGSIIDSVCLVWKGSSCGRSKGNCMLYDGSRLRYVFNLTAAAFTLLGGFFDILVFYYVKDLDLYKEVEESKKRPSVRLKASLPLADLPTIIEKETEEHPVVSQSDEPAENARLQE